MYSYEFYHAPSDWHDTRGTADFKLQRWAGNAGRVKETFRMVLSSCTVGSVLIWAFCMFGNELLVGIFMAEPIAHILVICTTSVCFYFGFHRSLKSMEQKKP